MRIVYMGTPSFAVPSLERLLADGHTICGVFTQPDKPQGRKMVLTPPPVKQVALQAGLPVYQPPTLRDGACQALLQELAPDVIVVVAYGKILPAYVLDFPKYGCINVHGSLLPRWRGAAPIQWSVIAGDKYAGVTTMQMDVGLDTGDMLLQYKTQVGMQETAEQLYARLADAGAQLLSETLVQLVQGRLSPVAQQQDESCYAPMLDKDMAVMDWSKSASQLDCFVRGLYAWPIATTLLHGERMKVLQAEPCQGSGAAGAVLQADAKEGLIVACGSGALRIQQLQMVGGKPMSARDYLRGHAIETGTILGQ